MRRLVPFGIPLMLGVAVIGVFAACTKDNAAIAKGGECFFANECAPGLVCVEQRNRGTRICTDDLSDVAGDPPGTGDEEDASDEGGEGGEGGRPDAPVVEDTGTDQNVTPDTGNDTGVDSNLPPLDAGDDG